MGRPSVFPTGTTCYNPKKCYNGYTLFPAPGIGAMLIDMNGKVVHLWKDLQGMPNKLLPGGIVLGHLGERDKNISYQDKINLVEVNWEGEVIWKFDHNEYVEDPGIKAQWMARCHHDFQREGNPVGYYVPGQTPKVNSGKTLILTHSDLINEKISLHNLIDDRIIEVDYDGKLLWEWKLSDHFKELGFSEMQKNSIYRNPNIVPTSGQGDWAHVNCASYLGANKWFNNGDERFNPENIILDSREANIMFIVSHKTGKIVWKIGPDFTASKELRIMGPIIGMHNSHMIPEGLPGEGNILVFDNGGWAGYGAPSQTAPIGQKADIRDYSRVLEFDPTTLKVVWEFSAAKMGTPLVFMMHYFYSPLISSAQRLPNGNTLITEGVSGRILEVTKEYEVVWEYNSPYKRPGTPITMLYRAYRYPYDWAPKAEHSKEIPIIPPNNANFRLPGAASGEYDDVSVSVDGTWGYEKGGAFCVEK